MYVLYYNYQNSWKYQMKNCIPSSLLQAMGIGYQVGLLTTTGSQTGAPGWNTHASRYSQIANPSASGSLGAWQTYCSWNPHRSKCLPFNASTTTPMATSTMPGCIYLHCQKKKTKMTCHNKAMELHCICKPSWCVHIWDKILADSSGIESSSFIYIATPCHTIECVPLSLVDAQ